MYFNGTVDDVWIIQTTEVLILLGDVQAKNIFRDVGLHGRCVKNWLLPERPDLRANGCGGDSCSSPTTLPFTTATVSTPFTTASKHQCYCIRNRRRRCPRRPAFHDLPRTPLCGECDLVLLHSSEFGSGLGLNVHIQTKIPRDMLYISGAPVRIGAYILEVASQGICYLNGEAGAELLDELSGFT
jgi:hypothetical protein